MEPIHSSSSLAYCLKSTDAPDAADTGGGLTAGNAITINATTVIKENIILFISILLAGLINYYLRNITFVIYIVAKEWEIPHFSRYFWVGLRFSNEW
jgi:hypothetical protein